MLVGGSTRVPALQERLKALFGGKIELCRSINPDEAVAVGAAVQGHILAAGDARTGGADLAGTTDLLLLDVTPLSLGIELEGREMSVLIKRNTTIPCRKSRSYTTVEDWQTSIDVVVYEVRAWVYTCCVPRRVLHFFSWVYALSAHTDLD